MDDIFLTFLHLAEPACPQESQDKWMLRCICGVMHPPGEALVQSGGGAAENLCL